jgi:hypothetical protein
VLILLWLHYIFFGVIFAVLARDAWRYNVRRIMALREDAKTQVGRHDVVLCCNTVLWCNVYGSCNVWCCFATSRRKLCDVALRLFCIPDRAFEPLRPSARPCMGT